MDNRETIDTYQADFGGGLITVEVGIGQNDDGRWVVWEDGGAGAQTVSDHDSADEAKQAAEEYIIDCDETEGLLDDLVKRIQDTGYFDDPAIVPSVIEALCGYSHGILLITPDIREPVGLRWASAGWFECDHISLPATYPTKEQAAESLLETIENPEDEDMWDDE